jgi:phosphatidylglycerophosphate synthase
MNRLREIFRNAMFHLAGFINHWTKGRIKPSHITALSLAGHVPVAAALVYCRPVLAAVLLALFASLDALDGALARVQKSASLAGMYFDAVSDRIKEIIVFSALAVFVYKHIDPSLAWQVVALAGTSMLVSYVKAKGEMAVSSNKADAQKLNRLFSGGIAAYEMRVVYLIVALLFGWVEYALPLMIAANAVTIAVRFLVVTKMLYILDQKKLKKQK